MKKMTQRVLAMAFAGAMLGACANKNDETEVVNTVDPDVQAAGLQSTWKSGCHNVALDVLSLDSQTVEYQFGSDVNRVTTYYDADTCATPVLKIVEWGTYENFDPVEGHHKIDIQWQKVSITPMTDTTRDLLNTVGFCGFQQWSTNGERDVTAQSSIDPVVDRCWVKTPRGQFDLVHISGSNLQLGATTPDLDKTSAEKRPTAIDTQVTYSK